MMAGYFSDSKWEINSVEYKRVILRGKSHLLFVYEVSEQVPGWLFCEYGGSIIFLEMLFEYDVKIGAHEKEL